MKFTVFACRTWRNAVPEHVDVKAALTSTQPVGERGRMATFVYRSTFYGPRTFTVADEGGTVMLDGKLLSVNGGYLAAGYRKEPLLADAASLEKAARRWWKRCTNHLSVFGHKANGIKP